MNENLTTTNTLMIWRCIAVGYPLPNITWSRNGDPISPNKMSTTIFKKQGITFVQSTLELCIDDTALGQYMCIATNSHTTANIAYNVFSNGRLSLSFTKPMQDKFVNASLS